MIPDIIEGNKLIAEFMRYSRNGKDDLSRTHHTEKEAFLDDAEYDSSWNQLMPVVEKINSFQAWNVGAGVTLHHKRCSIGYHEGANKLHEYEFSFDTNKNNHSTLIKNTFEAIVEFIKWYNSCKKI